MMKIINRKRKIKYLQKYKNKLKLFSKNFKEVQEQSFNFQIMKINKKLMKYTMNYIKFVWNNMNNFVKKKKFRIFKKKMH